MYPFKTTQSLPRNQWYIGAFSHEVSRTPMERTLLEEPVVFYRTEAGTPVAVAGRCPHRRFPMVRAEVVGDSLQCGYHGWTFDCSGACTRIPSQENYVPNGFKIRTYPVVETWQWLWVWMGDPAQADASLIPDHRYLHLADTDWEATVGGLEPLAGRYQLMSENVLDLTHITFIHAATIGTSGIAAAPIQVEDRGRYLHSQRIVPEPQPTAFHTRNLGLDGAVDRVLTTDFFPPAFCSSGSAFYKPGQGADPAGHCYGAFRVFHVATPETANTSHYFWAFTRSFGQGDAALTAQLHAGWRLGVLEDVVAIGANEAMIDRGPLQNDLSAQADAGPLRGRKMVESMVLAERETELLSQALR
jgi:phenylpropionate dioxygenase-like ring-hydroxylating dioxygenase large terminal subunit